MTRRRSIRTPARRGSPGGPHQRDEVRQQAQAVVAAPLGVELDAEQSFPRDGGHEPRAVFGLGEDDVVGRLRRRPRVRMDEVEVGSVVDAIEQRVVASSNDLVPADVRERWGVLQPLRAAGQHAEGLRSVLVTGLEQQLQAKAHAKEWLVRRDPPDDRVHEAGVAEAVHRRRGRPNARDDDRIGALEAQPDRER